MSAYGFRADAARARFAPDGQLALAFLLCALAGLAFLFSASQGFALRLGRAAEYFALRQAGFLAAGAALALCLAALKPETIRKSVKWLIILAVAAQLLPYAPLVGMEKNGARRWIDVLGFGLQPSEFLKPALVLYLAHIFAKKEAEGKEGDALNGFLPPLLVTALACAGVFLQNDLSTAVILALTALAVFLAAGVPLRFFLALVSVSAPLAILSVMTSEFRLKRIITYLFPDFDSRGISYQMTAAMRAVRSGGLAGKGLGLGTYKISSIPEVQSDFIFAAIAEEGGLAFIALMMGLYAFISYRSFRVSLVARDAFSRYASFGLAAAIAIQVLVNMAVVAAVVPATGVTLPLVSAGGSSLLATLASAGLILSFSRSGSEAAGGSAQAGEALRG
jgi:cell division protein FtsW